MSAINSDKFTLTAMLLALASDTMVGRALKSLLTTAKGARDYVTLNFTGAAGDTETFTIGKLVFEILTVNTDTNANSPSTATGLNTTAASVTQTITAHGLTVGAILRCESEYMEVVGVPDANTVQLARGKFGSTIAAHNNQDVFRVASARANPIPAARGRYAVPCAALAPANTAIRPLIVAACNAHFTALRSSLKAVDGGTGGVVYFTRPYSREAIACSETCANATITAAFAGGYDMATDNRVVIRHVVTSDDVTAGTATFFVDSTPVAARVTFLDASTGLPDTTSTVTSVAVSGPRLTVTEGTTQWVAGDILLIEAWL